MRSIFIGNTFEVFVSQKVDFPSSCHLLYLLPRRVTISVMFVDPLMFVSAYVQSYALCKCYAKYIAVLQSVNWCKVHVRVDTRTDPYRNIR